MTGPTRLILYTREHCHLCELAASLLDRLDVNWRPVDIDKDAGLEQKYGLSVPVLGHEGTPEELHYPFGQKDVLGFIERCGRA